MTEIKKYTNKIFKDIKHINEEGNEYWSARELMKVLEYTKWENFHKVIKQAMEACKTSNNNVFNHFPDVRKMVNIGSGTTRKVKDYNLSRYACYLIVMNGDPRKEVIALGQTYFAINTRKMEVLKDKYNLSFEDALRFIYRDITKKENKELNYTAKDAGVKNFDRFHNYGYKGLYGGETAYDIAKRKKLRYREEILDNMGSDELAANIFRISQTSQKLKNDNVSSEKVANETHYKVGAKVRKTIKELGGSMPEDLPNPIKSIKQLEKENKLIDIKSSD